MRSAREMTDWTDQQQAVFLDAAQGDGHTVVLARAGSGKTTTLLQSLKHLPPGSRALMLAFNRSVAEELKSRNPPSFATVATCHSFGLRVISRNLGYPIVDLKKIYKEAGRWTRDPSIRHSMCRAVSLAKSSLSASPSDIHKITDAFGLDYGGKEEELDQFVSAVVHLINFSYETCRRSIDHDDMIWLPNEIELDVPQYTHVFIDELQDWTSAQIELALQAADSGGRVIACGDDRQSCYSFRGALSDSMNKIRAQLSAVTYPLTMTFRCAESIVDEARRYVPDIEPTPDAPKGIVRNASEADLLNDVRPGDFVLSRLNAPLASIAWKLVRRKVKARVIGRDFGSGLAALIQRHGGAYATLEQMRASLAKWAAEERVRLVENEDALNLLEDKLACVDALSADASAPNEVVQRARTLFENEGAVGEKDCVRLSSIHRAKGLEADRVWVLWNTCLRPNRKTGRVSKEEQNLAYIAITRAREELIYVR